MQGQSNAKINKPYLFIVLSLMFVLPYVSIIIDHYLGKQQLSFMDLMGKWFVFWAVGVRLFTAGLKQVSNPSFTAESIFHLKDKESFVIVKELGFANICFGIIGIVSLFISCWRVAVAGSGGLYIAIAGVNHIIKKPVSQNEWIAMVSDIFIGVVMLAYIISCSIN